MATDTKYLYVVMMDIDPDKEDLFNELYDHEHIPVLLKVPGVVSATRFTTATPGQPKYVAIYEITSPDVPSSEAFRKAADSGEWPHKIRPYAKNRTHIVYARL